MLKSWSIENFKPIVSSGELKLAPVTVLAGRNSSGKSSLLQSILMISQTLSSRVLDRPLLPNGAVIQLGTFEDILNENVKDRTLTVNFQLEIDPDSLKSQVRRRVAENRHMTLSSIKSAQINVQFRGQNGNSSSAIEASKVVVESVSLKVAFVHEGTLPFPDLEPNTENFEFIAKLSDDTCSLFLKDVATEYLRLVPNPGYMGKFKAHGRKVEEKVPSISLVTLAHFLPARIYRKFKLEERRKEILVSALSFLFEYPDAGLRLAKAVSDIVKPESQMPEDLKKIISGFFNEEDVQNTFSGQSLLELANWFKALKLEGRGKRRLVGRKLQDLLIQYYLQHSVNETDEVSEGLEAFTNNIYAESLDQAIEQITRFFTSKIRYLGPLRADPQASQKFAPSSELDDVGTKGEYAAAVYDANQNARIDWYNPFKGQVEQSTLKEALDSWTRYLGVANQIKIEMAGQSGVSWQVVHLRGHKSLPLSAVGVGVSQILPILVMGLLAPANTLLIVEQPELHLHPRVQARLGDFFMGLAKCKKQCLIETHSENLVSQLRYHIVQAGGMDKSDCLIYFVDQDEKGATQFEPVQISPQGNILNWPDGFFDETMQQEDRITAASIRKRAK